MHARNPLLQLGGAAVLCGVLVAVMATIWLGLVSNRVSDSAREVSATLANTPLEFLD